jgi:hypothetical protein
VRGNLPIPELPVGEEVWLMVTVTSVRRGKTSQGKPFYDGIAQNDSGVVPLKIWGDDKKEFPEIKPGLWGIVGHLEMFQNKPLFVISSHKPIKVSEYRRRMGQDPVLPRAYTIDIETVALKEFKERASYKLRQWSERGTMAREQRARYLEDPESEVERSYRQGALSAASGRILSIAVHVGLIAEMKAEDISMEREYVFGIDSAGKEEGELEALGRFLDLVSGFTSDTDEIVGHNVLDFDLPFIFQRCLVHRLEVPQIINLASYNVAGTYDTMRHWWLGSRRNISLDDIAWALGIESSKSPDVDGNRVHDLYLSGKLNEVREYNLNDVRLARKIYERMISTFGR